MMVMLGLPPASSFVADQNRVCKRVSAVTFHEKLSNLCVFLIGFHSVINEVSYQTTDGSNAVAIAAVLHASLLSKI